MFQGLFFFKIPIRKLQNVINVNTVHKSFFVFWHENLCQFVTFTRNVPVAVAADPVLLTNQMKVP